MEEDSLKLLEEENLLERVQAVLETKDGHA